jgi:hypothetical protein
VTSTFSLKLLALIKESPFSRANLVLRMRLALNLTNP